MSHTSHHTQLGRMWDALQESGSLQQPGIHPDELMVITALHRAPDVPPPDAATISRIWHSVETSHSTVANAASVTPAAAVATEETSSRGAVLRWWRAAAVAVVAGFLTGLVVLGAGGRLAMRLAAMLSADALQGAVTANEATVGEITLGGSVELLLTGGIFGAALGLGYLLIANLLPARGAQRMVTSGVFFFAVCGFATLEGGHSTDYERFGIAGLNVCLFTMLPLIFGMVLPPVMDRCEQVAGLSSGRAVLIASAPFIGISAIVLLVIPPLQLFLLGPVVAIAFDALGDQIERPPAWLHTWSKRLALATPAIAGIVLTAVAFARIL